MVFAYLDEIVCSCVGEEIYPFFGGEGGGGEVLDEVVVDVRGAVGRKVVLVGVFWGVGTQVSVPPVPFCVAFVLAYVAPAGDGVYALYKCYFELKQVPKGYVGARTWCELTQ